MQKMKRTKNSFSLKILALVTSAFLFSVESFAKDSCLYQDFEGWKDCFVKDKLSTRINSVDVETFRNANYVPRVVELDKNQPEHKLTLEKYRKLVNTNLKASKAIKYFQENREVLTQIANNYHVDPEVIVALIAMESDLGQVQGNFNIIDSLATLSYEGRRKAFFEKELINALMISRNDNLAYETFKGSWAGAMGQCQFMPSSYLAYAVDFDGDGVKDIWGSNIDALASAANYLKQSGWVEGSITYKPLPNSEKKCPDNEKICALSQEYKLISLKEDGINHRIKVTANFDVLMKWNRSVYFGLAVLEIANKIKSSI